MQFKIQKMEFAATTVDYIDEQPSVHSCEEEEEGDAAYQNQASQSSLEQEQEVVSAGTPLIDISREKQFTIIENPYSDDHYGQNLQQKGQQISHQLANLVDSEYTFYITNTSTENQKKILVGGQGSTSVGDNDETPMPLTPLKPIQEFELENSQIQSPSLKHQSSEKRYNEAIGQLVPPEESFASHTEPLQAVQSSLQKPPKVTKLRRDQIKISPGPKEAPNNPFTQQHPQMLSSRSCSNLGQSRNQQLPNALRNLQDNSSFISDDHLSDMSRTLNTHFYQEMSPGSLQKLLKVEKHKRRKLSRLYEDQASTNELLKDENESLQAQQRALVRLLQEKDKMLEHSASGGGLIGGAVRQQSIERFVRRFHREIEDPEEIDSKHLILRRLILKKFMDIKHVMQMWRQATLEERVDEQRQDIIARLVSKSMSSITHIVNKAQIRTMANAFCQIVDHKAKRIDVEYRKTIASQLISQKLAMLQTQNLSQTFRLISNYQQGQESIEQKKKYMLIKVIKMQKQLMTQNKSKALTIWFQTLKRFHKLKKVLKSLAIIERQRAIQVWRENAKDLRHRETVQTISKLSKRFIVMNSLFTALQKNITCTKIKAFYNIKVAGFEPVAQESLPTHTEGALRLFNLLENKLKIQKVQGIQMLQRNLKSNTEQKQRRSKLMKSLIIHKTHKTLTFALQRLSQNSQNRSFELEKSQLFRNFQGQLLQFKEAFESLQKENQELKTNPIQDQFQLDQLRTDLLQKEQVNSDFQKEISMLKLQCQRAQNESAQMQMDLNEFTERVVPSLKYEKQELEQRIESLLQDRSHSLNVSQQTQSEQEYEIIRLKTDLQGLQQQLQRSESSKQQQLDLLQQQLSKLKHENDTLKQESHQCNAQLDQAAQDIYLLRSNYDVSVQTIQQLKRELQAKEDSFRQKLSVLESEIKLQLQESASKEDFNRLQREYEARIQRYQQEIRDKEASIDKVRAQNAEITRELVEATNASSHAQNDAKLTRDKLKKALNDIQALEQQLILKSQELQQSRNDHYQMLHKNKSDALRLQESLTAQIKTLEKENQAYESQLKYLLTDQSKQSDTLISYKDENERLKRQIINIEKDRNKLEGGKLDAEEVASRLRKEMEKQKRQLQGKKEEIAAFEQTMRQYQEMLNEMGNRLTACEGEKKVAEQEAKIIRQRYVKIVGAEKFAQDFPNK
ncbi:hypothetical protein FGO68_gene4595 [Halteria grandinella]|uniref:Uncharacterized protein n=1 Tax=Halteria grandinella TaxID=5974 RepID=A0A8J8T8A4_HALGN|nr:hypothetical protein FGO68_gene4595 [Halteria grandinella]